MRQKILSITQKFRLPSLCVLCQHYHETQEIVCSSCITLLKPLEASCQICALPLNDGHGLICGYCIRQKPAFDKVFAAYLFEEPLRTLIHQFKYHEGLFLAEFLSRSALPKEEVITECLIPVPVHPERLRKRGFNPAAQLAAFLSKWLNLPCERNLCKKITQTAPQAKLNRLDRENNLRRAFFSKPIPYEHVTLIDDLVTTGSTVNELAKTLKKQGAKVVDVWCCARATIDNFSDHSS